MARAACLLGLVLVGLGSMAASHLTSLLGLGAGQTLLTGGGFGLLIGAANGDVWPLSHPAGCSPPFDGVVRVIWAPALTLATAVWGWRSACLIQLAVCLVCAPLIMLLVKPKTKPPIKDDDNAISHESTNQQLWPLQLLPPPRSVLLLALTAHLMAAMALTIPHGILQLMMIGQPAATWWSAGLFGLHGLGYLAGSCLADWLRSPQLKDSLGSQFSSLDVSRMTVVCLAAVLLFMASAPSSSMPWLATLATGLGLLTALWTAVPQAALTAVSWPPIVQQLLLGAMPMSGLPLAALLLELTANLRAAFYLAGGLMASAGLLYSLAILLCQKRRKMTGLV
jgi:hypothetical protein